VRDGVGNPAFELDAASRQATTPKRHFPQQSPPLARSARKILANK
jgi:hypothetical protein